MGLIDADALAKEFKRMQDCDPNDNHYMGYASHFLNSGQEPSTEWDCVENALENAPTIDAIPVKWLEQRRFETSFHGAEPDIDLNYAFGTVMNEWQKEQEAIN